MNTSSKKNEEDLNKNEDKQLPTKNKLKTTLKINKKNKDELKINLKNKSTSTNIVRQPQQKMEDDIQKNMEDELNKNGWRPQG